MHIAMPMRFRLPKEKRLIERTLFQIQHFMLMEDIFFSAFFKITQSDLYPTIPEFCICFLDPMQAWHHYRLSKQLFPESCSELII